MCKYFNEIPAFTGKLMILHSFPFYLLPRMVKEVYSKCNCAFGFVMYFQIKFIHIILILFKFCHCIVSISFPA